jgi:hypothetical protein
MLNLLIEDPDELRLAIEVARRESQQNIFDFMRTFYMIENAIASRNYRGYVVEISDRIFFCT